MGRRAKPPKGKAEAKRPLARKAPRNDGARVYDLEKRLADALINLLPMDPVCTAHLARSGRSAVRSAERHGLTSR
jgi:hypothetical protein